ncbi:MAG: prealbumin-like fold domain-containing protein [Planctomycetaceae bacterium]|jgi:hypothetical protein|nr:prealbumin-like fold domain-containing protein [Planctomycetaceae bacterium]
MRITQHFIFLITLIFVISGFLTGCSNNSQPSDLPKLFPCKVTITQEGKPLEGATVTLFSKTPPEGRNWIISGKTNANGIAELVTQPYFSGAPEGEYKLLIGKTETDDSEVPSFEKDPKAFEKWTEKTKGIVPTYSLINPDWNNKQKTPCEVKITKDQTNTATFDVGKAVRIRIL